MPLGPVWYRPLHYNGFVRQRARGTGEGGLDIFPGQPWVPIQ